MCAHGGATAPYVILDRRRRANFPLFPTLERLARRYLCTLADPTYDEYKRMSSWHAPCDSEIFSIKHVNQLLQREFRAQDNKKSAMTHSPLDPVDVHQAWHRSCVLSL